VALLWESLRMESAAMHEPATRMRFPRMLLGAALIFWGWMVELPLLGLALAFLFEGPHWLSWRWDFGEKAYVRAWSLSVTAMVLTAFVLWLNGVEPQTVREFVSWMPLFLMPVQFTQAYGFSDTIPLNTFSYFSRKKMALDRELGMNPVAQRIPFTPVYFVATLLFSAAGRNAYDAFFFAGLLILTAWCLWTCTQMRTRQRGSLLAGLVLMASLAITTQWGLLRAHELLMGGEVGDRTGGQSTQWHRSNTNIGHVGKIKQSSEIFWRLWHETGPVPDLLMTASYNRYFPSGHWRYEPPEGNTQELDFTGLAAVGRADRGMNAADDEKLYRTTGDIAVGQEDRQDLPRFRMVGAVKTDSLMPLPGDLYTMYLNAQELEHNTIGSVRITPRHAVVETVVRWEADFDRDGPPFPIESYQKESIDRNIPAQERAVLLEVVEELGLRELPLEEKIAALRLYFYRNFTYSTYLRIQDRLSEKWRKEQEGKRYRTMTGRDSVLAQFLLEEKSGHCEYFATATTLLLRAAGVNARYCVGFSVQERNPKNGEYILRGTHAHAWCRVWNEQTRRWLNVDTTPPSWIQTELGMPGWQRDFLDAWQRLRENFTIWRIQPENKAMVITVLTVAGSAVAAWVIYRLWQTRARTPRKTARTSRQRRKTPLIELEKWLVKKIGPRPVGMPYAHWLRKLDTHIDPHILSEAIALHNQLRYDPAEADTRAEQRLREICGLVKARG
jgi:protein-glutamine gamma-glutamyltransferase